MYSATTPSNGTIPSQFGTDNGLVASYQCPQEFFKSSVAPSCATDLYNSRRYLTAFGLRELQALASTYDQTLICLTSDSTTVTWDVTTTSFPVYNKDHPLNDDYAFDSSPFDNLETKLINGGVEISTFTHSFSSISDKISLAFNDYTNTDKLTVIALNRDSCDETIMPLNDDTLESVGITSGNFQSLKPMEDYLVVFPLLFLLIAGVFGAVLKALEVRYKKIQIQRAIARQQKEFIREDGSVDRIQYLKDLYKIIKDHLVDIGEEDPIKALIENQENEIDERQQNEVLSDLEKLLLEFFYDLRFNDGELVEDKAQGISTDESENEESMLDQEEEEDEYNSVLGEAEGEGDSLGDNNIEFDEIISDDQDQILEAENEDEEGGVGADIALNLDKDMERDRREFLEGLARLGLSEEDKRILLERYEDSLRRARDIMKGDAAAQERARLAKLEERKNRKTEGKFKLKEIEDKQRQIDERFKERLLQVDAEIEDKVGRINEELMAEEDAQRRALEEKRRNRLKKFKDQFYEKIKGKSGSQQKKLIANHEKENERLIKDLDREKAYQEKQLIKEREARRRKKTEDATKELSDIKNDILRDQNDELEELEKERLMICAEYGLEEDLYGQRPLSKEEREKEAKRKANNIKEIELLRLKQRQRFEKMIEDIVPEEEEVENLEQDIDRQREEFKQRIADATNDAERQRLLKELEEDKEQEWAEELERQRQLQEQARFEKQKRRQLYKERNNFKLNSKHREENLNKELELMKFDAYKREEEMMEKINEVMEKEKGSRELPLKVYKMLEEMSSQRLDDQTKMDFYEISGRLSNLYTDIAFERALAKKNLEEDMNDKVKDLDSRNVPSNEFQKEVNEFQKTLERKGKDQEKELTRKQLETEMDIRGRLTEEHSNARKDLEQELHDKKQKVFERLGKDFRNEGILKLLMDRSREELENKLLKIAEEREEQQYKNELELVARTNKDLQRMEKQLEADLAKEKENMKNELRKRRNKVLKDLKAKYMNELKAREDLTKDQQDVLLKKKYEEEMSRFEAALAKESKEQQFRRLREKLILKRLEAEKDKELKRREARINRQVRDDDSDEDDGRRRRDKKGKGRGASLLRQLTDVMSDRIEDEYKAPRQSKANINVMLRNFKDRVNERQSKEKPGMTIQRQLTMNKAKADLDKSESGQKSSVFDNLCSLYMRYKADDYDDDDEPAFRRLQTEDVSVRSDGTMSKYNGEIETTKLLRRIIRIEKRSRELSESKAQQIINDLNQLSNMISKRK